MSNEDKLQSGDPAAPSIAALERLIINYGEQELGQTNPKVILQVMLEGQELTLLEISTLLGIGQTRLTELLHSYGLRSRRSGRPPLVCRRAIERGFASIDAYFQARPLMPLGRMATELGVSLTTIERYYVDFIGRIRGINGAVMA